jgi:hypothetical protein
MTRRYLSTWKTLDECHLWLENAAAFRAAEDSSQLYADSTGAPHAVLPNSMADLGHVCFENATDLQTPRAPGAQKGSSNGAAEPCDVLPIYMA